MKKISMTAKQIKANMNRSRRGSSVRYSHLDKVEKTGNFPGWPGTYRDRLIVISTTRKNITKTTMKSSTSPTCVVGYTMNKPKKRLQTYEDFQQLKFATWSASPPFG